jgi:hypothetical protein
MSQPDHLKCPFCSQTPSIGYFFKHIFRCHLPELFDSNTDWGKRNLSWLNAEKPRSTAYSIYLPKGQSKFCCLECEKAFNKSYYADKHAKCIKKSFEKHDTIKATLKIEPTAAPFCDPPDHSDKSALSEYRERLYQKLIYSMFIDLKDKDEWAYWFNKMIEDNTIHDHYKEISGSEMPDEEKYDPSSENSRWLRLLGISWDTIKENDRKKLPTPPS